MLLSGLPENLKVNYIFYYSFYVSSVFYFIINGSPATKIPF